VKKGAPTTYLQLPWTWNPSVFVATATGARAFLAGQEYSHGGVSPQECVLPVLTVEPLAALAPLSITKAEWHGLRLRLEVVGGSDLQVDLRLGRELTGPSVLKGVRVLDDHGRTSVLVSDQYEGQEVCLAVRSWPACPELLAQDLLDAARFVDRLLGAYLGRRAAQQLLGSLGHRREWWPEKIRAPPTDGAYTKHKPIFGPLPGAS
jgi:hypothetical protein